MGVHVKFCGITNLDDALAAIDAGADALGFVLAEAGKRRNRYIDPETADGIIHTIPPFVITVAVITEDDLAIAQQGGRLPKEKLESLLGIVDKVQLHGPNAIRTGTQVIPRCIPVIQPRGDFDLKSLDFFPYSSYLFDTYDPEAPGGTGKTGDWNAVRAVVERGKRIILAGGLTPENVAEAVRTVRPYAVDVSGGVEAAPGKKDHERLRRFIHEAKTSLA